MTADEDLLDTPKRRMVYVINCVGGTAFSHLEPRAQRNATKPWKDSEEMLTYLEQVFGNSNRPENAENEYQTLRQGGKDFNTFWAEFQQLAIELDQTDATLISDLTSKLLPDMQRQLNTEDEQPTDLFWYAKCCQQVYQGLKDVTRVMAAIEWAKKKRALSNNTSAAKKVATSMTTTQTTSFSAKPSRQLTINKRDQLMKKARCFTCKQVGHRTTKCSND